jgi:MFS family permease
MGMSNFDASLLVALYLAGGGLGGLLGGWIGDKAAARWPDHGRIVATQFSVIVGVPFALLLFKVGRGGSQWHRVAICAGAGFLASGQQPQHPEMKSVG